MTPWFSSKLNTVPRPARRAVSGALAATLLGAAAPARAQTFPQRPLTLIVPFPPGGNIDIVGRALSQPLAQALGQTVVVENRGGGGGSVGAAAVARAKPDGYTLLVGTPGQIVTVPHLVSTPYAATDFAPIGLASQTSVVLVARANDARWQRPQDVIAGLRNAAPPLTAAHPGPGTPNHLALLQLEGQLGNPFVMVPYRGSGPALVDLLGGQIDLCCDQLTSSRPHLQAGNLRALMVLGPQRDPALPDVPTLAELGLSEIDATTYTGVFVPQGVPDAVRERLTAAVQQAAQDAAFVRALADLGSVASPRDAQAFGEIMAAEAAIAQRMASEGRLKESAGS